MKFCQNCGANLEPETKFCASCGSPAPTTAPQANEPTPEQPQASRSQEPDYQNVREVTHAFTEAISGKTNIVNRAIRIITNPRQEWQVVAGERPEIMQLIGGYALVLALIPAICGFIKYGIIGVNIMGYEGQSIASGIQVALIQLISAIIGVYLLAWVIDLLAPSFDSEKNFGRSLQLAVYSATPQWIAGILLLFSVTMSLLIALISLYAIYLLATGMPAIKNTPSEKVTGYVAVSIIAMIGIGFVLSLFIASLLGIFFTGLNVPGY